MFWNKLNKNLVLISSGTDEKGLKSRSIQMDALRQDKFKDFQVLFENSSIEYPGFIEIDEVNDKIMTLSSDNS